MKLPLHGSNPQYLYKAFHLPFPDEVYDFSVNLNPLGMPASIHRQWKQMFPLIEDYPDPQGSALRSVIAEKEELPPSSILLGNGGAELIAIVANMLSGKRVLIVQPTFSEYEKMCRVHGCSISFVHLKEGLWPLDLDIIADQLPHIDALFICHPNNPTGIVYPFDQLQQLLNLCEQHDCLLVMDEAFYDFVSDFPFLTDRVLNSKHLIIIRSLTKMYAIAGLRLGYLIAHEKLIQRIQKYQAHWSVNAIALEVGQLCMEESSYVQQAQNYVTKERQRLFDQLKPLGYQLSKSSVNYYLLRDPAFQDQKPLIYWMLKQQIVPRHTYNFPGLYGRWIRLAVKQRVENDRLLEVLRTWKRT